MDFADNKLTSVTKKIIDLIDQPNMQPNELKAYFDSSPEELRQAYNGLCDALTTATSAATAAANLGFQTTAGVPADNVQDAIENVQEQLDAAVMGNIPSGSVTGDKLAQDVRDRFTAIETAATTEASTRASADSTEASARAAADNNLQGQINTHTTQIAAKCEVVFGSYTGNGAESRTIALGFYPKAVFVIPQSGQMFFDNIQTHEGYGGLALRNSPCFFSQGSLHIQITNNGFSVFSNEYSSTNQNNMKYFYIAFKA